MAKARFYQPAEKQLSEADILKVCEALQKANHSFHGEAYIIHVYSHGLGAAQSSLADNQVAFIQKIFETLSTAVEKISGPTEDGGSCTYLKIKIERPEIFKVICENLKAYLASHQVAIEESELLDSLKNVRNSCRK